jgi:PTS system fructose-specific IIA component
MAFAQLLTEDTIRMELDAQRKEECIEKLAATLGELDILSDQRSFVNAVLERETLGTTGIGFGIAIPHGKSSAVKRPSIAFARLKAPIDWQSLDDQPVTMVFLSAVPEESANEHLQSLASLSRKLIHEEFRDRLANAANVQDVLDILRQE